MLNSAFASASDLKNTRAGWIRARGRTHQRNATAWRPRVAGVRAYIEFGKRLLLRPSLQSGLSSVECRFLAVIRLRAANLGAVLLSSLHCDSIPRFSPVQRRAFLRKKRVSRGGQFRPNQQASPIGSGARPELPGETLYHLIERPRAANRMQTIASAARLVKVFCSRITAKKSIAPGPKKWRPGDGITTHEKAA